MLLTEKGPQAKHGNVRKGISCSNRNFSFEIKFMIVFHSIVQFKLQLHDKFNNKI